jgi:hypothetical protein
VTERPPRRVPAQLLLCLPLCVSIGAGAAKLSHCSDLTLLIVTVAPCADCVVLYCLVVAVYRAEVRRYLNARPQDRRAIREFNAAWVEALVSVLALIRKSPAAPPGNRPGPSVPAPRQPLTGKQPLAGKRSLTANRPRGLPRPRRGGRFEVCGPQPSSWDTSPFKVSLLI